MLQEALCTVKVAEEKAILLVKESEVKAKEHTEEAHMTAKKLQEQEDKLAKQAACLALKNAEDQMLEVQKDTERKVTIEIEALKEKAQKQEAEAIDKVLTSLY